ncbi:Uncharacterised protein [Mycobacteroides abscessus subsp. abscessus]|nr:Uncharacterised protein [Mycobacteroides abscessus subsp. abscessus]
MTRGREHEHVTQDDSRRGNVAALRRPDGGGDRYDPALRLHGVNVLQAAGLRPGDAPEVHPRPGHGRQLRAGVDDAGFFPLRLELSVGVRDLDGAGRVALLDDGLRVRALRLPGQGVVLPRSPPRPHDPLDDADYPAVRAHQAAAPHRQPVGPRAVLRLGKPGAQHVPAAQFLRGDPARARRGHGGRRGERVDPLLAPSDAAGPARAGDDRYLHLPGDLG